MPPDPAQAGAEGFARAFARALQPPPADPGPEGDGEPPGDVFAAIERILADFFLRLEALVGRVAALESRPAPRDGEPGRDADPAELAALRGELASLRAGEIGAIGHRVAALESRPAPRDGDPGRDADPAELAALRAELASLRAGEIGAIAHRVAALELRPAPRDGEPGRDADPAELAALRSELAALQARVAGDFGALGERITRLETRPPTAKAVTFERDPETRQIIRSKIEEA